MVLPGCQSSFLTSRHWRPGGPRRLHSEHGRLPHQTQTIHKAAWFQALSTRGRLAAIQAISPQTVPSRSQLPKQPESTECRCMHMMRFPDDRSIFQSSQDLVTLPNCASDFVCAPRWHQCCSARVLLLKFCKQFRVSSRRVCFDIVATCREFRSFYLCAGPVGHLFFSCQLSLAA